MTHYDVLGLPRGASQAAVTAAFRRLGMRWHPDRNPGDALAKDRFTEVTQAYRVLRDPELRREYDRELDAVMPVAVQTFAERALHDDPPRARRLSLVPRVRSDAPSRRPVVMRGHRESRILPLMAAALFGVTLAGWATHFWGPPSLILGKLMMSWPVSIWSASRPEAFRADAGLDRSGPLDREDLVEAALAPHLRVAERDPVVSRFMRKSAATQTAAAAGSPAEAINRAFRIRDFDWREGDERRKAVLVLSLPKVPDEYCQPCDAMVGVVLLGQDVDAVSTVDRNLRLGHFGSHGWFSVADAALLDIGGGRRALQLIDRPGPGSSQSPRIELVAVHDGVVRPIGRFDFRPAAAAADPEAAGAGSLPPIVDAELRVLGERDGRGYARIAMLRWTEDPGLGRRRLEPEIHEFDGTRYVPVRKGAAAH